MSAPIMRGFVRAFCDALAAQDPEKVRPYLDDQVECAAFGPVDIFPFFGQRRGKEAVLAMVGDMARSLRLTHCAKERTAFDGENYAALIKVSAVHGRSGRTLSFRLAQFAQFRDDKLISLRVLFDSLDLAEQALGRQFDLSAAA